MNNWDRNNLNFLLSLTPEEFVQFMDESDEEDLDYALELVQREKAKVITQIEELRDSMFQDKMDLSDARAVLTRFRL